MSIKFTKHQDGTTLMELMVYLAISTVVILAMTTFVSALTRSRVALTNQSTAQAELRNVMERLTYAVRNSHAVSVTGARIDLTDESGMVTTFCACDGTMKSGQLMTFPPALSDLHTIIDSSVTVQSVSIDQISTSVRIRLTLAAAGQTATASSTIAYRQLPSP